MGYLLRDFFTSFDFKKKQNTRRVYQDSQPPTTPTPSTTTTTRTRQVTANLNLTCEII